jgi:hypothetical protein
MRETLEGLAKVKKYVAESEENAEKWQGFVNGLKDIVDGDENDKKEQVEETSA